MFRTAISLRFIDITDKSWQLLQTFGWNLKLSLKNINISHSFDALVLLTSVPSEMSILLKL